ncbi:general substrate transporter [Aspergillus pseudodeflectus]|uniref:General substrate transporter n=1 Tax=Aspergillus pseudodeflectus TaxID=176178 RepID=A0ABR4L989_9EURO
MDPEKPTSAIHDEGTEHHLAHLTNQEDHARSKWEAIKAHPWAFAWCIFGAWTILLVSFENQAGGIVVSIPQFRKDFGTAFGGDYVLDTTWQSAFQGGPGASMVVGALGAAVIADWIGRRNTLMIALVISYAAVSLEVVSTTNEMFFGGKFLNGFAVGAIQAVCATYIGEIVPLALRGLMTCLIALAFTLGPFIVSLIVNEQGSVESRWAYRSIFVAQYGFAAVTTAFIFFMPESPWWLANKGQDEKALHSLSRLGYSTSTGEALARLSNIKVTLEEIQLETSGVTYLECFRKSNLRRTIVSIAPLVIQQFTGIVFAASYSTYYAQLAGYSTDMSFKLQVTQQVLSMVGNITSWYLVDKVGRRDLTLYGTAGLTVILWVMGGLAVGGSVAELRGAVAMILLYCFFYNVTIGATAYTCLTETATSRLRIKTIAIGLATANSLGVMWSFVLPYLFNPDRANLGGKLGFVFGGLCFPSIAFIWWYQPETRGRSYEELDEMFVKKVPARKFGAYKTEVEGLGEAAVVAKEAEGKA